jgi:hypothetical protein
VAKSTGLSEPAVSALFDALVRGNGTMAQFNHPDLGGLGQWMRGGMVMVGDMFNHALAARVRRACEELSPSAAAAREPGKAGPAPFAPAGGGWWPAELGSPSSTGGQNAFRYAYFPAHARLAVEHAGKITLYDTTGHAIGGFSQQQGASLALSTPAGTILLHQLKEVPVKAPPPPK